MERESGEGELLSVWGVVRWWEIRRLVYNAVLLVVGLISLLGAWYLMLFMLPEGEAPPGKPLAVILDAVVFLLIPNICYTLGWITEITFRRASVLGAAEARKLGAKIFYIGTVTSCLILSLPLWIWSYSWIVSW